ncbi:MAG: hypothetical protein ABIR57_07140 [Aeromicrobium sp.]
MTPESLQAALGFTSVDLEHNRAGRLSPAQQAHMTVQGKRGQTLNLVMGGVFVAFVIFIVVVVLPKTSGSESSGSSAVPPGVILGVLAVVGLVVGLTLVRTRRAMGGLSTGGVRSTEGPARTKARAYGNVDQMDVMPVYRLKVGAVTFPLPNARQLGAFEDGIAYRCYYVKGTLPVLISAEQL